MKEDAVDVRGHREGCVQDARRDAELEGTPSVPSGSTRATCWIKDILRACRVF